MSLVLNTNIDALVAQNSLTSSGSQLATALQQLSSGLRINTAADDAAGYAIAQGMTSQINGLHQAAQNANDGVSLAQTASGALSEVTNDLQTMRDLAVESLNASNGANDRADLNAQFQQLMSDINSVASQTQFNGVNLLDGSFQGATFQVGANAGQSITMSSIASSSASAIGDFYNGTVSVAGTVKTATGATISTTAGSAGNYNATNLASANGLNTAVNGSTVELSVAVDGGQSIATGPITLTGTNSTDLKSVAAAINQALSSTGGLVATVNSQDTRIVISGTTANGSGHVVNFSVAGATDAGGNTVNPGNSTLGSLGVDSSDTIGTNTPTTGNTTVSSGGAVGSYSATSLGTILDGTSTVPLSTSNTAKVNIQVSVGGNTYTASNVTITGTATTDEAAITSALGAATDGASQTLSAAGYTVAYTGNNLTLTQGTASAATANISVSAATGTANNSITTTGTLNDALGGMGIASQYTFNGTVTAGSGSTSPTYSVSSLQTDLQGTSTVALSTTAPATVTMQVSVNGSNYSTSAITIEGNSSTDMAAIAAALNTTFSTNDLHFTAAAGSTGVAISGSGASTDSVSFAVTSMKNTTNNVSTPTAGSGLLGDLGMDSSDTYTPNAVGTSSSSNFLSSLNVKSVDSSNLVLVSVDQALQQLATISAQLGAYQNRFQSSITGLNTDSTNLTAAKSSIVDADYAQATSNLSKAQILQQASTAMVAQANTIPQNILTLLQKLP